MRNQFRALDDDEVEFLDEVRQKKRDEELRARRETEEGLRAFKRQQQREAEAEAGGDAVGTEDWGVAGGRKRRRGHQGGIKGLKRRETSEGKAEEAKTEAKAVTDKAEAKTDTTAKTEAKAEAKAEKTPEKEAPNAKPKLGLVDYGSDSDSE